MSTCEKPFQYTQNIVVRTDLRLSLGKLCGQVAHAAVLASEAARSGRREWWEDWLREGQRKVVLKAQNYEELLKLKEKSDRLGLPTALVEDRGLTEVPRGTVTCLGIGPAPSTLVNKVTGSLPLL